MNDENKPKVFKLTLPKNGPGVQYIQVTIQLDPSVVIEQKLAKMEEFPEAQSALSKFTLNGKN
jgi:hypothetical protein